VWRALYGAATLAAEFRFRWVQRRSRPRPCCAGGHPASDARSTPFHRCREIDKTGRDYLIKFLSLRDAHDRLHPVINALGAQTARMFISPPLQRIPRAGDARSCLRAEPGQPW
jgi:hypothetical protein